MELHEFGIMSIAHDFDRKLLLDYLLGREFMLHHDLRGPSTSIITSDSSLGSINKSGVGIALEPLSGISDAGSEFLCIPVAVFRDRERKTEISYPLDSLYNVFGGLGADIFTSFRPATVKEVQRLKHGAEDRRSGMEERSSRGLSHRETGQNVSVATDSYYQSYEKRLLEMLLGNVNEILMSKCLAYKVTFFVKVSDYADPILRYLKSNAIVLGQERFWSNDLYDLYQHRCGASPVPLSYGNAAQAIGMSGRIVRMSRVATHGMLSQGDIHIGKYIDSGMNETDTDVCISSKVLNLGTLVTGLPGTGKTKLAQSIAEQALRADSKIAIISPTGEWNGFGTKNSLEVIRLGRSEKRINLFRCEVPNRRKFYENLAMLVAVGCNSGPYKNSVEKCLVAAFSRAYSRTSDPDPQQVYGEIEEAIIEQHGKRTSTSVKYTKHGENTRSALESLRQLLMIPQFAYSEGISFADLIGRGVIFDLTEISNNAKPLVYAMILNQLYNMCDQFDLEGDNGLRLILCLEESQLIFDADEKSGATLDLGERIQNFRKNGVGLMLVTHNVNDISPGIRRLCQNKFYFRQSADVAKYAAGDLVFGEKDYDKVIAMLKILAQRTCAISMVSVINGVKSVSSSIFAKTGEYEVGSAKAIEGHMPQSPKDTLIKLVGADPAKRTYEIRYLGELVAHRVTDGPEIIAPGLLEERPYKFILVGEKRKDTKEFGIVGGRTNEISFEESNKSKQADS
jgi:hypothetical protein